MIGLRDVTLCMIDATCPELARLALNDSLAQASFEDVLVCSPDNLGIGKWVDVPRWPSVSGMHEFLWYELPDLISTKHVITISWDGWIIDGSMWTDEFLRYDYIGAPWWYDDGLNVGNGNALRSRRLMKFLAKNRDEFPRNDSEDAVLCREHRPRLEHERGFRWAPEQLASRFALESTRPSADSKHFAFHSPFNFPHVLDAARLEERIKLMRQSLYLQNDWRLAEIDKHPPRILSRLGRSS